MPPFLRPRSIRSDPASPASDVSGGVVDHVVDVDVDVADPSRIEALLTQAQAMGAVFVAGSIARDFDNTLTVARGYGERIRNASSGAVRGDAASLIETLDRGRQLSRRMLDFARATDRDAAVVDLREVVIGIEPLIRRLIGAQIVIRIELPAEAVPARVVVGQLEQALFNLAINARGAMPDGGVLRIRVEGNDAAGAAAGPAQPADAAIVVEDTGVGIPDSTVASIFEPFFTTEAAGAGTGFGLATVRGFAETAGGRFTVATREGVGRVFTLRFPNPAPAG